MRYYLLILITLLLTSCSSLQFRYGALTAVSHYDGIYYNKNSKVEVINNDWDFQRKLRTDFRFRNDFAWFAQNQPLSWYYRNFNQLGGWRSHYTPFDIYWNRHLFWSNWSFNYGFIYGYGFNRGILGLNNWGWNHWNYNPYRWNYRPNYIITPRVERPRVIVNGRRGSNTNRNIIINRGRSNDNNNVRVRRYDSKDRIVPRRNYNDVKIENRTPIRSNNRIRTTPPNRNSNPIRVNPPTRTPNNVRSTPTRVTRPNISRGSSSSSRSSVGKRGNN